MNWTMMAVIVAGLSFVLSLFVAYHAYFRGPSINVLVGRNIFIYPAPLLSSSGITWGGVGIYLPITFVNSAPKGGSIYQVRLTINRTDDLTKVFDIAWSEFGKILEDERRWGNAGVAQPISIPGRESISKTVQFIWHPSSQEKMVLRQGRHTMKVFTWLNAKGKPSLVHREEFVLSDEHYTEFQSNESKLSALTINVPLGDTGRQNGIFTMSQVTALYGE